MSDLFRLDGKTAIVTGASRGLGAAMADALAEAGARVIRTSPASSAGQMRSTRPTTIGTR